MGDTKPIPNKPSFASVLLLVLLDVLVLPVLLEELVLPVLLEVIVSLVLPVMLEC